MNVRLMLHYDIDHCLDAIERYAHRSEATIDGVESEQDAHMADERARAIGRDLFHLYALLAPSTARMYRTVQVLREAELTRRTLAGEIDPECRGCQHLVHFVMFKWMDGMSDPFYGPRHKASSRCESGKHAHCSCDVCF